MPQERSWKEHAAVVAALAVAALGVWGTVAWQLSVGALPAPEGAVVPALPPASSRLAWTYAEGGRDPFAPPPGAAALVTRPGPPPAPAPPGPPRTGGGLGFEDGLRYGGPSPYGRPGGAFVDDYADVSEPPAPEAPQPPPPMWRLLGVVGQRALVDPGGGGVLILGVGDVLEGWRVSAVGPGELRARLGDWEFRLGLE